RRVLCRSQDVILVVDPVPAEDLVDRRLRDRRLVPLVAVPGTEEGTGRDVRENRGERREDRVADEPAQQVLRHAGTPTVDELFAPRGATDGSHHCGSAAISRRTPGFLTSSVDPCPFRAHPTLQRYRADS